MNIPEQKIATTSSHQLCKSSCYIVVSGENRELMYKELESRGVMCKCNTQRLVFPTTNKITRTRCQTIGNQTHCDTQ